MRIKAEDLQSMFSERRWSRAVNVLTQLDPAVAADAFLALPEEEQQLLFSKLPLDVAAKLASVFHYYDVFVLLQSLPADQMSAVIRHMNPVERSLFLDQLPEGAWENVVSKLSEGRETPPDLGRARAEVLERLSAKPAAAPVEVIIQARQVEKSFNRPDGGTIQVIAPTTLSIEAGTITALLGPSGSGKSTLLRMLSGLTEPSAGEVLWHGKPVSAGSANAAIVFQSFALFPWLTVIENVEVPLFARGIEHRERHDRAVRVLNSVGLEGFEAAYPKELSGGMKQRVVSLAR